MQIHNISKSSLFKFLQCPYNYNEGKKKTIPSNSVDCSGLIKGVIIHNIIDLMSQEKDYNILDLFLDILSGQISRGIIKIDNYYELLSSFNQSDIFDLEEANWTKYKITWPVYEFIKFEYKDETTEILNDIPKYIEPLIKLLESFKNYGEKTEIKHNIEFPLDDDNTIHITSIFDKIYKMDYKDVISKEIIEIDKDELIKEYEKLLKAELLDICSLENIEVDKKDIKIILATKIINKRYDDILQEKKEERKILIESEKEYLKNIGYSENDKIDVITDFKFGKKSKNENDIKGMLDIYIYSCVFYATTNKIPVFKIVNLNLSRDEVKIQDFNIFLTLDILQDFINFFMSNMKALFIDKFYPKNIINNWKCNPKYCEFYNDCQKDKILITRG